MSFRLNLLAAVGAALVLAMPARAATGIVMWHDLSLDLAKMAAEATLQECQAKGYHTAAVVVDRSGNVLVTLRDERATPQMMEMARRKAFTAKMFRRTTKDWAERTRDGQDIAAQRDLEDVLALSGGVPIQMGDETIGAVGSAGSTLELDDACAHTGANMVTKFLK